MEMRREANDSRLLLRGTSMYRPVDRGMLLLWWPFHPTGFALAHAFLAMTWVWFPMLMGWAAKAIILRYGGMKLYRAWIPFFLGLLLGDVVIGVLWSFVGAALDIDIYMFFPG